MADLARRLGRRLLCGFAGLELPQDFRALLNEGLLGGIILFARNYHDRSALRALTREIHTAASAPVFIAVDQEGGRVVRFVGDFPTYPSPRFFAERRDPEGLLLATRRTAAELRAVGVNLNLIPVCDLTPADSSHVIHSRSYSADPQETAAIVSEQVKCLHQERLFACAKHFPGLGSAYGDPHLMVSRSDQSLEEFVARDYLPFQAATAAGVDLVMLTHLLAPRIDPDEIATFSKLFLQQELRERIGFDGIIISDDLLMAGALTGISPAQAGLKALAAGCDLLIYGDLSFNIRQTLAELVTGVESERMLTEQLERTDRKIEEAYRRCAEISKAHLDDTQNSN